MQQADNYFKQFTEQLKTTYADGEAEAITSLITEELLMLKRHQLHIVNKELSADEVLQFDAVLKRLLQHEPVQYILGYTYFYNLRFKVNPSVLIPRQETEELVNLIIKENSSRNGSLRMLDIGTGSGCIAVALKKNIQGVNVVATDISETALETAKENALQNRVDIEFILSDILNPTLDIQHLTFDIIVSNPPYIMRNEEVEMSDNVLRYEPHTALFVTDNDPLQFYKAIGLFARKHLNREGKLYVEINQQYGNKVVQLFSEQGFHQVECLKDIHGNNRIVKAVF